MWIMEFIWIFLVVSLMSSPVLGVSQSMSCSMVNGQTICEKQTSAGNSAAAFGGAAIGGGGQTYQDAYAGAGNPGQWDYGRQTVYGNIPGYGAPPQGQNSGAPPQGQNSGAPPSSVSSGSFSSSSSSSSDSFPGFGFASAGGFPAGGGGFAFGGGYPAQGNAGGFATSGVFPFGGGYPAQAPAGNPDAPNPNQGQPQGFDPFVFVRPFMGGGGGGGGVAVGGFGGFGGFPFGRR